eukprot:1160793-Pelagomonas_calceolata.AAC.14
MFVLVSNQIREGKSYITVLLQGAAEVELTAYIHPWHQADMGPRHWQDMQPCRLCEPVGACYPAGCVRLLEHAALQVYVSLLGHTADCVSLLGHAALFCQLLPLPPAKYDQDPAQAHCNAIIGTRFAEHIQQAARKPKQQAQSICAHVYCVCPKVL